MEEYKFKDGAAVWVHNIIFGTAVPGIIRGAATTPMWGIGRMWIVEVHKIKSETYPYSFVSVPENALE